MKKKVDYQKRNSQVAANRTQSWKQALVRGKLDARLNPSKIYSVRANKKAAQIDVAKALNLSLSTFGAIERKKRQVPEHTAKKIGQVLGVKFDSIFKKLDNSKYLAL